MTGKDVLNLLIKRRNIHQFSDKFIDDHLAKRLNSRVEINKEITRNLLIKYDNGDYDHLNETHPDLASQVASMSKKNVATPEAILGLLTGRKVFFDKNGKLNWCRKGLKNFKDLVELQKKVADAVNDGKYYVPQ